MKGFDYLGLHRYSLRFCTDRRRPLFAEAAAVHLVLAQISRAAEEQAFAVLAYCFMPDHLHLLVEGRADHSDAKRFIARAKQYSGFYYSKQYKRTLWQRYGYEHLVRDEEATLAVARYILENPIRAGLAQSVDEYPYVGSLVYSLRDIVDGIAWSG